MASSPLSLIVVGGGIVGLTLAVAAKARGHVVTVIADAPVDDTASGIAAGMIAPALEALNDPEPVESYARLKAAQAAWFDLFDAWPQTVQSALRASQQAAALYVWPQSDDTSDHTTPQLEAMAVGFTPLSDQDLSAVAADCNGVRVTGEMLIAARAVLAALEDEVETRRATVHSVTATSVTLDDGKVLTADAVVVAAGYGSKALLPSLDILTPIKGHILDVKGQGGFGVTRSPTGYYADYGTAAKFGATMQFGQDDLGVEEVSVTALKTRALDIMPGLDLIGAVGRAGIRAASPDTWPMIGRDAESGVYVATAMRRNGYIFAPFAAKIILDLIAGETPAEAGPYDPSRF